jgi:hypothetical protein
VAAGPPGAVVIDDQGRVEVTSGTVPDGLVDGARVGLCFAEHG